MWYDWLRGVITTKSWASADAVASSANVVNCPAVRSPVGTPSRKCAAQPDRSGQDDDQIRDRLHRQARRDRGRYGRGASCSV